MLAQAQTIFTIGTGHRQLGELIGMLCEQGVVRLLDVRSYPKSHLPHFCGDVLAAELGQAGIDYRWLGNRLGGLRREGYEQYMRSDRFAAGLRDLIALASERPSTVCCAEIDPYRCHRSLIADTLVRRGWQVLHIVGQGEVSPHQSQERQVVLPFDY